MTFAQFRPAFREAVVAFQHLETDEEARVYFSHLRDLSLDGLRQGLATVIQASPFWPKIADWRQAAHLAEAEAYTRSQTQLVKSWEARAQREQLLACVDCQDTGWVYYACPETDCGRRFQHAPHNYVSPCPCRATNAVYQAGLMRERARRGDASPDEARQVRQKLERGVSRWRSVGSGGDAA
jgi:hypothetical protein